MKVDLEALKVPRVIVESRPRHKRLEFFIHL